MTTPSWPGVCPRCHRPADRLFWVGTKAPPAFLPGVVFVGDSHRNWQACSTCKTCECIGAGLLTPPPDLDEAQQLIELSAYTETKFVAGPGRAA